MAQLTDTAQAGPGMTLSDSPANICLICLADYHSINAYPIVEDQIKCQAAECFNVISINMVASIIMQSHYQATELSDLKAGFDFF